MKLQGLPSPARERSLTRRRLFGYGVAAAGVARAMALRPAPRLTVLVVLEQFRPDYLGHIRDRMIAGGFRRLLEQGAWFADCRHLASTFSASGLATIATGAWPSQHGIVADSWYDRLARRAVRASGEELLGTTVAAEAASTQRRRVWVVGMDPVHTRLFAGNGSASLYWMDAGGQFTTAGDPPEWLVAYNRQKPIENLHDAGWLAIGAQVDAPPLRVLRYDPARPADFISLYKASPFAQMAQFEFLRELMAREKVGQSPTTDLVCLLLGSTNVLGYDTGARSPLMTQMVMHLDRHLEFLFDQLNRIPGRNEYNVVLTAAHGAPAEPPSDARDRMAVQGERLAQAVQASLAPAGANVEKYVYPFLYLDGVGRDPEPARLAAAKAAQGFPGVAGWYTAGGGCSLAGEWATRFRNSFHTPRSGDLMLSYRPGYIEHFGSPRGVSYGSLYNYDVQVPLCFYGPQFVSDVFEHQVTAIDIAPTLARAIGIPAPSSAIGRVLGEAFRENAEGDQ